MNENPGKEAPIKTPKKNKLDNLRPAWKKGQSGNPKGRTPGTISIVAGIKKKLEEIPDGQKKTYLEIFLAKFFKKVLVDEDVPLMKDLINRVDGMPKQAVEVSGDDEQLAIILEKLAGLLKK